MLATGVAATLSTAASRPHPRRRRPSSQSCRLPSLHCIPTPLPRCCGCSRASRMCRFARLDVSIPAPVTACALNPTSRSHETHLWSPSCTSPYGRRWSMHLSPRCSRIPGPPRSTFVGELPVPSSLASPKIRAVMIKYVRAVEEQNNLHRTGLNLMDMTPAVWGAKHQRQHLGCCRINGCQRYSLRLPCPNRVQGHRGILLHVQSHGRCTAFFRARAPGAHWRRSCL